MELMLEQHKKLLHDKEKSYCDLEEEFRLALRIEASRYHKLQVSHQVGTGMATLHVLCRCGSGYTFRR